MDSSLSSQNFNLTPNPIVTADTSSSVAPPTIHIHYHGTQTEGSNIGEQIHVHLHGTHPAAAQETEETSNSEVEEEQTLTPYNTNEYEVAERVLRIFEWIFIISTIAGLARMIMSFVQLGHAVLNKINSNVFVIPEGENYFKHAVANFGRSLIALFPVIGSLTLGMYDKNNIRVCYENEPVKEKTLRWWSKIDETNAASWKNRTITYPQISDPTGFSKVIDLGKKIGENFINAFTF